MKLTCDPHLWAEPSDYNTIKLVYTSERRIREAVLIGVGLCVKHLVHDYSQKSLFSLVHKNHE
jgi:hypothetical protein